MSKVLIVEDEKKIRDLYKKLLKAEGMDVIEAENGEQATVLLLQDKDIDLFLLDIQVPIVNGAAFYDAVKVFNPHAKVVVSSVYSLDKQKRMVQGADDYFDKSEGIDVLIERIKKILSEGIS